MSGTGEEAAIALELERPITIYACDIDGCLAAADHAAYDLDALGKMAAYNASSGSDEAIPKLTLVTGRPQPYAEAFSQLLAIDLPYSFENGAGLATRRPYRAWLRDDLPPGMDELKVFAELVEREARIPLDGPAIALCLSGGFQVRGSGGALHQPASEPWRHEQGHEVSVGVGKNLILGRCDSLME